MTNSMIGMYSESETCIAVFQWLINIERLFRPNTYLPIYKQNLSELLNI